MTLLGSVATLIAAFAGFFFGALWTHHLTTKREERRRAFEAEQAQAEKDQARRALAAELHAELYWIMRSTRAVLEAMRPELRAAGEDEGAMQTQKHDWRQWEPEPMVVLESHIGELSRLPQDVAIRLMNLFGTTRWLIHLCANVLAEMEPMGVTVNIHDLRAVVDTYESIVRGLLKLNDPLAEIAGVEPHDWGIVEGEIGPGWEEDAPGAG